MVICPECESDLDIEEDEVDEGEIVSCPECGTDFEVVAVEPLELSRVEEEEEDEDDDKEEEEEDERLLTLAAYAQACRGCAVAPRSCCFSAVWATDRYCTRLSRHNRHPPRSRKHDYALIYGTVWGPDDQRRVPGVPIKSARIR